MRKFFLVIGSILLLLIGAAHAQQKDVTGTVTDATGTPVPNASIRIKGTKTGTSADANGQFHIKAAANTVLIVSGIGFETREVPVGSGPTVQVRLSQDTRAL